jgi:hypothetical protein
LNGWLTTGRVVCKGQKGIRIVVPDTIDDGNSMDHTIKPVSVFDVTRTHERTPRVAA